MSRHGIIRWYLRKIQHFVGAVLVMSVPLPVFAATQMLGLAMTNGPIELKCQDGECAAEFTGFCLQKDRKSPGLDAPYVLAPQQNIKLTLASSDGTSREIAAASVIKITATRFYAAIKISIPEQIMSSLGAESAMITVGKRVTLLPVMPDDDPSPLSPEEIAFASGSGRAIASAYFDGKAGPAGAVRILSRAINAVEPFERLDVAERQRRWRSAIVSASDQSNSSARSLATGHFDLCQQWLDKQQLTVGLRGCLEGRHDSILRGINTKFWRALKPGS